MQEQKELAGENENLSAMRSSFDIAVKRDIHSETAYYPLYFLILKQLQFIITI